MCLSVAADWRNLGCLLGVAHSTLEEIRADNRTVKDCMYAMTAEWLKKNVCEGVVPTWRGLCEALSYIDKPLAESVSTIHACNLTGMYDSILLFYLIFLFHFL